MADNKYCNITGSEKISETYDQINEGFSSVEEDKNDLQSQINNHNNSNSAHDAQDITFESIRPTLSGADDTKEAIEKVDQRVDELVNNPDPNKDLELVDLRTSSIYGVFSTAKARLDNTDNLFSSQLADIAIYARDFKNPSETDWGLAINRAINSITMGTVILPKGDLPHTTSIIQKSNITIKGQGIGATKLKPVGCHGITTKLNEYLRFAVIEDLTISGDNEGVNTVYDKNKHGINWNSGNKETLQCRVDNVRIENMGGKGLYAPNDFSNRFEGVSVSNCGGNGIELNGFITDTLVNCYVDYVAPGYAGYRIYSRAHLVSCNGMGGSGDYWGVFGRRNNLFVDTTGNEVSQYFIVFENCNIEDFKKVGLKFIFSGGFELRNTVLLAPETGTFECYIDAEQIDKFSIIDGLSSLRSKGSTMLSSQRIKSNLPQAALISYTTSADGFTVDGISKVKIPVVTTKYTYLNNYLSLSELHVANMPEVVIGGKKHVSGIEAPKSGNWVAGDTVHNSEPSTGEHAGWICIASGSPGTWMAYGQIGVPVRYPADSKPTTNLTDGYMIFDLTIGSKGAPIWWNGTIWVNASGEPV